MSRITIEVELNSLSTRGQEAFRTLMEEMSLSASPAVSSGTVEQLANKLYERMARKKPMKSLLDALLDAKNGQLSLKEIEERTKLRASRLAGVLSAMTRNLKRYHKVGRPTFLSWDEVSGVYRLSDPSLLAPLINAKRHYKAGK